MGFWGYHGGVSICLYIVDVAFGVAFLLRMTEVIPPESWKYLELVLACVALAANIAYWIFLGCCGMLIVSQEAENENELRSQHHSKSTIVWTFAAISQMVFLIVAAKVDPIDPDTIVTSVTYNPAMMTSFTTQKVAAAVCLLFAIVSLTTITDYYYYKRLDRDTKEAAAQESTETLLTRQVRTSNKRGSGGGAMANMDDL